MKKSGRARGTDQIQSSGCLDPYRPDGAGPWSRAWDAAGQRSSPPLRTPARNSGGRRQLGAATRGRPSRSHFLRRSGADRLCLPSLSAGCSYQKPDGLGGLPRLPPSMCRSATRPGPSLEVAFLSPKLSKRSTKSGGT